MELDACHQREEQAAGAFITYSIQAEQGTLNMHSQRNNKPLRCVPPQGFTPTSTMPSPDALRSRKPSSSTNEEDAEKKHVAGIKLDDVPSVSEPQMLNAQRVR